MLFTGRYNQCSITSILSAPAAGPDRSTLKRFLLRLVMFHHCCSFVRITCKNAFQPCNINALSYVCTTITDCAVLCPYTSHWSVFMPTAADCDTGKQDHPPRQVLAMQNLEFALCRSWCCCIRHMAVAFQTYMLALLLTFC